MRLVEASAKSNMNITEIFTSLAKEIIDERVAREKDPAGGKKTDSFYVARGSANKKSSSNSEGGGGGGCKC